MLLPTLRRFWTLRTSERSSALAWLPRRRGAVALVPVTASLLVGGCAVNSTPPILLAPVTGQAIVDWTIREAKDPVDCQTSGAATLQVSLADFSGAAPMVYEQDCAAFATTISRLVPDTYTGTVELLDGSGNPLTTSVKLLPFSVTSGTTTTVAVDFPASSFF
jgi:hypothetical protein